MSLSGATFKLYKVADLDALASGSTKDIEAAEKLVSTKISDDKGKIDFSGQGDQKLETSVLRYFKETTAPTGFIKYDDITCVVLGDRDDDAFNGVIAKLKEKGVNYETKASYVRCNTPTFHTRAEFKAKKLMTGDRTSLADGEFSFVAKDANGTEDGGRMTSQSIRSRLHRAMMAYRAIWLPTSPTTERQMCRCSRTPIRRVRPRIRLRSRAECLQRATVRRCWHPSLPRWV